MVKEEKIDNRGVEVPLNWEESVFSKLEILFSMLKFSLGQDVGQTRFWNHAVSTGMQEDIAVSQSTVDDVFRCWSSLTSQFRSKPWHCSTLHALSQPPTRPLRLHCQTVISPVTLSRSEKTRWRTTDLSDHKKRQKSKARRHHIVQLEIVWLLLWSVI